VLTLSRKVDECQPLPSAMKCTIRLLDLFTVEADIVISPSDNMFQMKFELEWSIAASLDPFHIVGEVFLVGLVQVETVLRLKGAWIQRLQSDKSRETTETLSNK